MKTHIPLTDDLAQEEDLLQRYKERIERLSQQDRVSKFCTDARFLTTGDVGQYFMTQDTEEFSRFTDSVACRESHFQEMKIYLKQKVGFEGTLRLDPYWKLQPVAYKVNMEWKLELSLWTRTILTRGTEFLMAWISWSQTWTRSRTITSRKPLRCSSKILRWKQMYLLLRADQRPKQNHKDVLLPAHPQKLYLLGKNFDRHWTTRIFALWLFSVEATEWSSSS